ncbi:hypothetical protein BDF14DRAFT_1831200 [Spinellus fusiger]|nr:hypothetical protein BDF14DRAFT_1831200 [Spinellus fusiger]
MNSSNYKTTLLCQILCNGHPFSIILRLQANRRSLWLGIYSKSTLFPTIYYASENERTFFFHFPLFCLSFSCPFYFHLRLLLSVLFLFTTLFSILFFYSKQSLYLFIELSIYPYYSSAYIS